MVALIITVVEVKSVASEIWCKPSVWGPFFQPPNCSLNEPYYLTTKREFSIRAAIHVV